MGRRVLHPVTLTVPGLVCSPLSMGAKWTFGRRRGECAATGRTFEDGERHVSTLAVRDGALERLDLSLDAWRERGAPDDADEHLFWWYTRHSTDANRTLRLDLESLERLFIELEGREERAVRELRYVLCLLLMRKRRLKVDRVERDADGEWFVVHRPRHEERLVVHVFDFGADRMEVLRQELQAIFDGAEGPDGVRLGPDEEGDGPDGGAGAEGEPTPGAPESSAVAPGEDVDRPATEG